jgi:Tfp pilus assembly protein FimT
MLIRALVAVLAVLAIAGFAVAARDVHLENSALALAPKFLQASGPQLTAIRRDLSRARFLNPDQLPRQEEAEILLANHRWRAARAAATAVTRREPDNLGAWSTVYQADLRIDPAQARRDLGVLRRLDPVDWRPHR